MCDSRHHPRQFRTFNVIDGLNCEAWGIDMEVSLPAGRMSRYVDKLAEYYGYPLKIRMDNAAEFTGKTFIGWAKSNDITLDDIQLGRP